MLADLRYWVSNVRGYWMSDTVRFEILARISANA